MILLQILGILLVLSGLGGLGYCIWRSVSLARAGLAPEALRNALQALVPVNLASVGTAALGLALLLVGLLL